MRILKYLFIMAVLIFIAIAVFVATQKGDYEIVRSRFVKTPKNVVYNYVNDLSNWQSWMVWTGSDTEHTYSAQTAGAGATFSFEGDDDGTVKTLKTKDNDSIVQKMDLNGLPTDVVWTFKDTAGGTKITWRIKGKLGFMPKIRAALQGGPDKVIGEDYEKSLVSLEKTIIREINTYSIAVNGTFDRPGAFYLYQSITSTIDNTPKNIRILMQKMRSFFEKNKMKMHGPPFVAYDYFDDKKGIAKFAVCIPVAEEVFIQPGSDVQSGKFPSFHAVKTTLKGDYSHLKEAWDQTFSYIDEKKLAYSESGTYLEVYEISKPGEKSPSKWVTTIYIPVNPVVAPAPVQNVVVKPTVPAPVSAPGDSPDAEISIP